MDIDASLNNLFTTSEQISLNIYVFKLILGTFFFTAIAFFYKKFNFNNEFKNSNFVTFPILGVSVILIITVIKSSIALSLGLVGALSIVRLRTPIKNSEELIYYFLIIGISICLGADRIIESIYFFFFSIFLIFLLYKYFIHGKKDEFISNIVSIECSSSEYLKVQKFMKSNFEYLKFISLSSYENKIFMKYSVLKHNENNVSKLLSLNKNKLISNVTINNLDELSG